LVNHRFNFSGESCKLD